MKGNPQMTPNTKPDSTWVYDHIMCQPDGQITLQQHITYRRVADRIEKETITRRYYGNNDYQDSVEVEVISRD